MLSKLTDSGPPPPIRAHPEPPAPALAMFALVSLLPIAVVVDWRRAAQQTQYHMPFSPKFASNSRLCRRFGGILLATVRARRFTPGGRASACSRHPHPRLERALANLGVSVAGLSCYSPALLLVCRSDSARPSRPTPSLSALAVLETLTRYAPPTLLFPPPVIVICHRHLKPLL